MKKRLLALAAAIAISGFAAQSGTANAFLLSGRSPNVTAAQLVVGAGTFGAYLALTRHHHHHHHNKFHFSAQGYGLTTVGCMGLTPILGGLFWQAMFNANPHWDRGTGGPTRR